jgi:uncharacterized protein CbrC (UPF0167 family)
MSEWRPDMVKNRKFRYLSDDLIPTIFKTLADCDCCGVANKMTIRHSVIEDLVPRTISICADCIEDGEAFKHFNVRFHPYNRFTHFEDGIDDIQQIIILITRTPPIDSIDQHNEPYRWGRHCGDFAIYLGDVRPRLLDDSIIDGIANHFGCDAESIDSNSIIHKFECIKCKEILHRWD